MLKGKNILAGTALYLAAIWALYDQKKVTFKDQKELEAQVSMVGIRKATGKDKKKIEGVRAQRWEAFQGTKGYVEKDQAEFGKKFVKLEYVR